MERAQVGLGLPSRARHLRAREVRGARQALGGGRRLLLRAIRRPPTLGQRGVPRAHPRLQTFGGNLPAPARQNPFASHTPTRPGPARLGTRHPALLRRAHGAWLVVVGEASLLRAVGGRSYRKFAHVSSSVRSAVWKERKHCIARHLPATESWQSPIFQTGSKRSARERLTSPHPRFTVLIPRRRLTSRSRRPHEMSGEVGGSKPLLNG